MTWKKIGKTLLYPHLAIMIILVPISTVFLVYSMVFCGTKSVIAIISYVLAVYTLSVWCIKIPCLIRYFQWFKAENKYARKWQDDTRLRVKVSLYGTLFYNTAYALLHLGMGFWHNSFWFYSLAEYYILLAIMRFFLVRHTSRYKPCEQLLVEFIKYRTCGIVFLIMNFSLALIIFFMVYWNRTFNHHEVTSIILATYTFISLTLAIINTVKYRKYNSPVYSASKAISLASACVSMLILESTMLTTFGDEKMTLTQRRALLGISGAVISAFIITMAIYMIVKGTKNIKLLGATKE